MNRRGSARAPAASTECRKTAVTYSCRCPDEFENTSFACHALGNDGIKSPELEETFDPRVHILTNQDRCPGILVQAFKAGSEIDGVTERRVVHALAGSEVT